MTEKGSGHVRNDFLSLTRGDYVRIVGGKFEGHLALFNSVKKAWIEVRVRKCPGWHRPNQLPVTHREYTTTYLPPFNLEPAPNMYNPDHIIASLNDEQRQLDVRAPSPLYMASGPRVSHAFAGVHDLLNTLNILSTDADLLEYSLSLAKLIKTDLIKLSRGEETAIQRITDTPSTTAGVNFIDSEDEDDNFDAR
jgi:hypothetical protein